MECKEAKEWINRYTDEEIDEISKMKLKHHINNCDSCKLEYDEMLELHSLIQCSFIENDVPMDNISENIMKSIKPKNKYRFLRRSNFMKKKIIAASVMAVLLTISFVPINNTSLAATIKDWLLKDGAIELAPVKVEADGTKEYDLTSAKEYDNVDEAKKGLEYSNIDFIYPDSIPKGYELSKYFHPTYTEGDINYIMSFNKIVGTIDGTNQYDGFINIGITKSPYITELNIPKNIESKEVNIAGYDSIIREMPGNTFQPIYIDVFMEEQKDSEKKLRNNNYHLKFILINSKLTEDEMIEFVESYIRAIDEIDNK